MKKLIPFLVIIWHFYFNPIVAQMISWQQIDTLPEPRSQFFSFEYNESIYIVGGVNSNQSVDGKVNFAEIENQTTFAPWVSTNPVTTDLYQFGKGINRATGYAYILGGRTHGSPLKQTLYSQIQTDGTLSPWQNTTSLPQGLNGQGSLIYNNKLYQLGGVNTYGGGVTDSVIFTTVNVDGTLNSWDTTSSLPIPSAMGLVLMANEKVYHIGGLTNGFGRLNNVFFASINSDGTLSTWSQTTNLPEAVSAPFGFVFENSIFVMGGDGTTPQSKIYKGEVLQNGNISFWQYIGELPQSMSHTELVKTNAGIYLLGGEGNESRDEVYFSDMNNFTPFESLYTVPQRDIEIGESNLLWAVAQTHGPQVYNAYKVNLNTGIVFDSLAFNIPPENDGRGVAWDGTNLWYSEWDFDKLYVINPVTGDTVAQYPSPGFGPQGLAFGDGYIWHTDEFSNVIYKINPANGTVVGTLPVPELVGWYVGISYYYGALCLMNYITNKLTIIDAINGNLIFSATFPFGTTGDITCDNTYIYLVGEPNNTLYRFRIDYIVPVELVSLSIDLVNENNVNIKWTTSTETNCQGFRIYRNSQEIAFLPGAGSSTKLRNYFYEDNNLQNGSYEYILEEIDYDGEQTILGKQTIWINYLPKDLALYQNYPNPFNPSTKIKFTLTEKFVISLKIYDMLGRQVADLVNGEMPAGFHEVEFHPNDLASGIYYYKLTAGNKSIVHKMILLR